MFTSRKGNVSKALFPIYIGILLLVLASCSTKEKQERPSIISSHTTGVISVKSPIRIHFQNPLINIVQVSTNAAEKLIEISPKVEGKAIWANQNMLEFMPNTQLKPNTEYEVTINFSRISDTILSQYTFTFRTIKPTIEVNVTKIEAIEFNNKKGYCINGVINANDYISHEKVSEILSAEIESKNLTPIIQSQSGLSHSFMIDSIPGTNKEQLLHIKFDGSSIGAEGKGEFSYKIPSISNFTIINQTVLYDPEPMVIINFSNILHPDQDFTGMIQIENISKLQILSDKNSLKIYPKNISGGKFKMTIHRGIKSISGEVLNLTQNYEINLSNLKPELRKTNAKIITPPSQQGALFEFEATHLKAVDVRIYQVFQDNVIQFLQVNAYNENWELDRVGKIVYQSTINLEGEAESSSEGWNKYFLDLSKLIKNQQGSLYHIQIGFRKEHVIWDCTESSEENSPLSNEDFWNQFENYSYDQHSWRTNSDPCSNSYYGFRKAIRHNYLSSNTGLIAKKDGKNKLTVFAT